ncbi:MAG: hypothetical protein QE164_02635 [Candidatus Nezhaarchaeota archaeon]|nr:hypothetical protein [Candidatus Nezhaarchaeota archaeon]
MGQLSRELLSAQRLAKKLDRGEDPVAIVGDHVVYRGSKLKIVEVKEEVVAGEKVLTYRTSEGASFQYWTKQRRITTPFRVEWYQLSPTNRLFVEPRYLNELLKEAIERAGSMDKLLKQLKKLGVRYSKAQLHYNLKKSAQGSKLIGVKVELLRGLLAYLERPYSDADSHIIAVGSSLPKSVKTSFPVNLEKPEVGTLLAAALGNGSYPADGRFTYKNTEKEMVEKVKSALESLLGNLRIEERIEEGYKKQIHTIRASTEIVRRLMENFGIKPGPKDNPNPALEILPREAKIKYIQQTFDDEGWIARSDRGRQVQIAYTKSFKLKIEDEEMKRKLNDFIDKYGREELVLGASPVRKVEISDELLKKMDEELARFLRENEPPLIKKELNLLAELIANGDERRIVCKPREVYRLEKTGEVSVRWLLLIGSKDMAKEYRDKIGFHHEAKRRTLNELLGEGEDGRGGDDNSA